MKKYFEQYESYKSIKICADPNKALPTLEPQIVEANRDQLDTLREILDIEKVKYPDKESIIKYMKDHKTDCALKIFDTTKDIKYPQYILNAVRWEYEQK